MQKTVGETLSTATMWPVHGDGQTVKSLIVYIMGHHQPNTPHSPTLLSNGQASHNVYVSYGNLLDEVAALGEDLHAGTLIATVTHHVLARVTDDSHFAWVPQLPFLPTCVESQHFLPGHIVGGKHCGRGQKHLEVSQSKGPGSGGRLDPRSWRGLSAFSCIVTFPGTFSRGPRMTVFPFPQGRFHNNYFTETKKT